MFREIENRLETWKASSDRKPLIISGARQIGKTYSCRAFAKKNYVRLHEINFQDDINARNFFSSARSIRDILMYLEVNNVDIPLDDKTLIFFDEIQLVPELITSLKFFHGNCLSDVICSGSMLGIALHGISSFPVGYVDTMSMYPMSFNEFVIAQGMQPKYISEVADCAEKCSEIPLPVHDRFNELFTQYIVCGGMPEAVSAFVNEGLAAAIRVNRRLMQDLKNDIAHYADSKTRIKAMECFESLPLQLAKDNKKFQYKLVHSGYNARHFDESLLWLKNAGIVYPVHRLKSIAEPLEINVELGVFKEYLFDTGLLASQFSDGIISRILTDALGVYKGVFYENITAQTLVKLGKKCYYYEPNSSSEIDFIIELDGCAVPIEVKGGLHTRSTSFNNFIKNHNCSAAFRFSKKNAGKSEDGITRYLPVYTLEWALSG